MAKTKAQKQDIIRNLSQKIGDAKSIIFASFNRLTVKENEDLRKNLKTEKNEYCVAKKTLLDIALREHDYETVKAKDFAGRIAAVFGFDDEVSPAKIVGKFKKDHEGKIDFISGIMEKKLLSKKEVEVLAELPSKLELKASLVGSLAAPLSGFANVLAGNLRGLLNVLKAVGEKKS